ncbi:MAG: hypothetical protein KBG29_15215 [Pseudomonadales bacterium]|jgi:hypothetical protein|nr:hypothetical protein [Pseudomonadales bacterium]
MIVRAECTRADLRFYPPAFFGPIEDAGTIPFQEASPPGKSVQTVQLDAGSVNGIHAHWCLDENALASAARRSLVGLKPDPQGLAGVM